MSTVTIKNDSPIKEIQGTPLFTILTTDVHPALGTVAAARVNGTSNPALSDRKRGVEGKSIQ
jgi:hypothetical protein